MRNVRRLFFLMIFVCAPVFAGNGWDIYADFNDVIEAVGGQDRYDALPDLDLKGRMGSTGYIDFITPKMMNAPVMKGEDKYGRSFLVLQWVRADSDNGESFPCALTIFERYSGPDFLVMGNSVHCRGYGLSNAIQISGHLTKDSIEVFAKVMKGEVVSGVGRDEGRSFRLLTN